jgi:SH3-like domain-containing protein
MLQGRRTILVVGEQRMLRRDPEEGAPGLGEQRVLRRDPEDGAPGLAYATPGVIGEIKKCRGDWCKVILEGFTGWLRKSNFYGAYGNEDAQ